VAVVAFVTHRHYVLRYLHGAPGMESCLRGLDLAAHCDGGEEGGGGLPGVARTLRAGVAVSSVLIDTGAPVGGGAEEGSLGADDPRIEPCVRASPWAVGGIKQ
jgi:hypothetical protein